jgi:hypothetical protein
MNVLWASFDLIAREIGAKEQNCRSADLLVADYKEKMEKVVNPAFI